MVDPVDAEQIYGAISKQGVLLGSHKMQQRTTEAVSQMGESLQQLQAARPWAVSVAPDPPPLAVPISQEPKIPAPQHFGKTGTCKGFLNQVSLIFNLQPSAFVSETAKIA